MPRHGLRPPILDDLGLVAAVHDRVIANAPGPPLVRIEAPERLPALPAAIELAALRIIQEAVPNVCRHAQAGLCTI